jgi:hypothetical protein
LGFGLVLAEFVAGFDVAEGGEARVGDVRVGVVLGGGDRGVHVFHVVVDVFVDRAPTLAAVVLPDVVERPWMATGAAPVHDASSSSLSPYMHS